MYNKPEKCCYPNCFDCTYKDCCYDGSEYRDVIRQNQFDRELEAVDPSIRKRRARQSKYAKSDKGIARYKRYIQSDKGKEMLKRKQKRSIESGKNAECCRRYYQKMKAKKLLEAK